MTTVSRFRQLISTIDRMYNPALLFKAPEVNPINHKARSIPGLNVINIYGRVFFFSWFGFMIAFWSWYAFPPLVCTRHHTEAVQPLTNSSVDGHDRQRSEAHGKANRQLKHHRTCCNSPRSSCRWPSMRPVRAPQDFRWLPSTGRYSNLPLWHRI